MPVLSYLKLMYKPEEFSKSVDDLERMLALAKGQKGFLWAEVTQPRDDRYTWIILSEWEMVEDLRAWEHHPDHEKVMDENKPRFRDKEVHRRFQPWVKPAPTPPG